MSLMFLVAFVEMFRNDLPLVSMDFFIAWALFAIADAIWLGRCKR